ncbi:hypothetical protein GBT05_26555 [Escherichia coli]|nr:hypothetical protein [Escherichia coli]EGM8956959.1 hypothetical protein [Escherichia coli]NNR16693.1 hypothetical protein [Escherichia coli]NNR35914.1 hypothetical protein [Escherichia coli]NNR55410.1 hypothetical protein [Escherichia coli]
MLPSETMIWQPEFTDKTLSRKPGAVQFRIQNQICYPRWNTKTYAAVSITTDTGSNDESSLRTTDRT